VRECIKSELRSTADSHPAGECTFAIVGGEPLVREETIDVGSHATAQSEGPDSPEPGPSFCADGPSYAGSA
jgi:hypothetical protein